MDNRLQNPALAMRVAFGLMATLAGLDKFFNILADWGSYVSPVVVQLLPFSTATFMGIVGIVEMVVGLAILGVAPAVGAYVASAWLLLVAGNLLIGGQLDVAVRDVVLAVGAFTLARLEESRQGHAVAVRAETGRVSRHVPA
jgi:hypothetical protein